ncbi:FAD:protein FMN transferase [Roseibacillus ishigakijimensis]|uniref:FAD:protein FMN transferase n=1 Tax=Roseibacillus ishigakijimensis TaxID=454146 RepID=A0A934VJW5_9BACT|nr:FAD:protein FMN transferase [Roseibacillus ishigakijimensis]MBK1833029.1 FAD:protein FMN transferase [Roseibacillus ishigakijimensis]
MSGEAMGTTWRLVVRESGQKDYEELVRESLQAGERSFSNWDEDSEVSRWLRGEVEPSAELHELLALAEKIKVATGGVFDVAWAGGCDLGGIAKGWAVDRVGEGLLAEGLENFVFELGGEVLARGSLVGQKGWPVTIESPHPGSSRAARTLWLRDEALATSGNYHQPFHLRDGRDGAVVGGAARSVSVVLPTCAEADAWATALFVLNEAPASFPGQVFWNQ